MKNIWHRRDLAAILLISLFLASVFSSFHHHEDFKDHNDCPVCIVSHTQAITAFDSPEISAPLKSNDSPYLKEVFFNETLLASERGRSPPLSLL
ncbi:MAG: hypothetical protein Q7T53_02800 [Deltaproteobacteria bacterium]|nr:hypothetical protein [Deltaproteobacteria bacterium]